MNATAYLTETGLTALIRNPNAVRTWPQQQMPAFTKTDLPDSDIDAVIAYLRAKAPGASGAAAGGRRK
jgi:mono/diheme cytochrome c family protein